MVNPPKPAKISRSAGTLSCTVMYTCTASLLSQPAKVWSIYRFCMQKNGHYFSSLCTVWCWMFRITSTHLFTVTKQVPFIQLPRTNLKVNSTGQDHPQPGTDIAPWPSVCRKVLNQPNFCTYGGNQQRIRLVQLTDKSMQKLNIVVIIWLA